MESFKLDPSSQEIFERISKFFYEITLRKAKKDSSLSKDLLLDFYTLEDSARFFENKYIIFISTLEMEKCETVRDAIFLIKKRIRMKFKLLLN